jgi:ApeA-like protein/HEPN superfamily Apea-like protein
MMLVTRSETEGSWWLPDTPHHRVPGTLLREAGGRLTLVTHAALRQYEYPPPVDGVVKHSVGHPEWHRLPLVHGYFRDGNAVTLMGAAGTDMSGPFEKVTETYSVEIALIGSHLQEDRFSEVQMEFDWLSDWLALPSIIGDDPRKIDLSVIERMPLTLQEIIVRHGKILLRCGVEGTENEGSVHLDRVTFVSANPTEAADWKHLLQNWVRPMQDLLTVSLGRVVQVTRLHFRPVATERFGDILVEARFHVTQPTPIAIDNEQGRHSSAVIHNFSASTLYTGSDTSYCVNCVIRSWMLSWQENSGLIALLLAHLYAPFMYTAQRYGSIFQTVEGLHARFFAGSELDRTAHKRRVDGIVEAAKEGNLPADDIEWVERVLRSRNDKNLAARIEEVVSSTGTLGKAILERKPNFGRACAALRGNVAHPSSSSLTPDLANQYWHGEILSWVARVILLQRAGVKDAAERASQNFSFRESLNHMDNQARPCE